MKPKYTKTYKSYLATKKRKDSEAALYFLKSIFLKNMGYSDDQIIERLRYE